MYTITKRMEIAGCHCLKLNYDSKCQNLHGHNWIITVTISAKELDENGMVFDFSIIKNLMTQKLDHQNLNTIFDFNPTAENIAFWVCQKFSGAFNNDKKRRHLDRKVEKVEVQESEGNIACYIP